MISTTGTWDQPFWPSYPGMSGFAGRQLHTADYRTPDQLAGQRVVCVMSGGNIDQATLTRVLAPTPP